MVLFAEVGSWRGGGSERKKTELEMTCCGIVRRGGGREGAKGRWN